MKNKGGGGAASFVFVRRLLGFEGLAALGVLLNENQMATKLRGDSWGLLRSPPVCIKRSARIDGDWWWVENDKEHSGGVLFALLAVKNFIRVCEVAFVNIVSCSAYWWQQYFLFQTCWAGASGFVLQKMTRGGA